MEYVAFGMIIAFAVWSLYISQKNKMSLVKAQCEEKKAIEVEKNAKEWKGITLKKVNLLPDAKLTLIVTYKKFTESGWNKNKTVYVANDHWDLSGEVRNISFDQILVYAGRSSEAYEWLTVLKHQWKRGTDGKLWSKIKIISCRCSRRVVFYIYEVVEAECGGRRTLEFIYRHLSQ